ncbi:RNase adapter RapZ [Aestuariicella hydrocarbonica]|uniref:RNase adapter RapZ n=1 Tax=Pseudomaricurvus hydrocarbonicus TaxID=1470433 RepID=A0A9E5MLD7_9GAMM|nr:RNase adapter RapZ [Aestuariicella hydrocarbonica]NHO64313.1 RNase adapter RapZ [Aestuariicella hydrocarbonica]
MRLVVISGRSGSGKSTALHVLEDVGFTCIDNLPASLLPALVQQLTQHPQNQSFAVSIDARNTWQDLQKFPELLSQAKIPGLICEILFLDARSPILIQRFSETRRKHPLSSAATDLKEAIALERTYLEPIANAADLAIDTSSLTLHQLRDLIKQRVVGNAGPGMALLFQSFGFKRGIPVDVDLVFDVRCLPNPYWKPNLRSLSGQEQPVIEFLEEQQDVQDMYADISHYLRRWLPRFSDSNRSYFTVAIGCTGGHHRSVYLCERLFHSFKSEFPNTQLRHRELDQLQKHSANPNP